MTTDIQRERTALRTKLCTGCMVAANGRGGSKILESSASTDRPGLVQMWPLYLDLEIGAARPTLALADLLVSLLSQGAAFGHLSRPGSLVTRSATASCLYLVPTRCHVPFVVRAVSPFFVQVKRSCSRCHFRIYHIQKM